jgi:hypothetical protein
VQIIFKAKVARIMTESVAPKTSIRSHSVLLLVGLPLILITGLLALRNVWEETSLSLERGPQMVGFALAHGSFALLLLAPPLLMIWLVLALIVTGIALWRRQRLSGSYWVAISLTVVVLSLLVLPAAFWQRVLIERFAKSPYAVDFMTEDAAVGYTRTVGAYLDHGISVDARGKYGTAANAAAVGGSVEVLKLLQSRHANLNSPDSSGISPLSDAIEMKRTAAIMYLKSQGALEIKPTPPLPGPASITVTP